MAQLMFVLLLFGCLVSLTVCNISGTNPPIGTCVCTTASDVDVTDTACGNVVGVADLDECYSYTGVKQTCTLDQQSYDFFQLNYGNELGWVDGSYLRTEPDVSLCGIERDEFQVLIIGDWGELIGEGQENVAAAMANWSEIYHAANIYTVGDNFYPNGIHSWDDPQVDIKWRDVYNQESIRDLVWKVTVGNHDYGHGNGVEWNQVELTDHEPRWYLPHLWYDFVEDVGDHDVHFVMIDTEAYREEVNNHTEMVRWMETTLSQSTARWKLVIGHRNAFSAGDYGPVSDSIYYGLVKPIMEKHQVDAYICGHEHNLQHIRNMTGDGLDYVITGAGGALLYAYSPESDDLLRQVYGMETPFFRSTFGFVALTTTRDELIFDYYSGESEFLYQFTRPHSSTKTAAN